MNMTFISKELKENKLVILTALIILGAITPIYPYSYSSLLAYLLGQGTTYEKFLWYDWFLKAQPQITIIAAIIMGSTSISKEKRNATLGILVTKPASRTNILVNKLLAGSIALIFILAADTFILTLVSPLMGAQGMEIDFILLGLLGDILLVVPIYLMSAAFSIIFLNSIKAGLLSAGVVLLLYGPVWLGSEFSVVWWLLGNAGALNPVVSVALAAAGAFFVWLGAMCFSKIEV